MAAKLLSPWDRLYDDVGVFETPVVLHTNTRQLVSRVVSGLVLISLGWLIAVSGLVNPHGDDYVWLAYAIGAIMLLLAAGSQMPELGRRLAHAAMPLYCAAVSLAVYAAACLLVFRPRDPLRVLSLNVIPLFVMSADVALGSCTAFQARHLLMPQLVMAAHSARFIGFWWLRYGLPDVGIPASRLARHCILLVVSIVVVLASNAPALLRPTPCEDADIGELDNLL